MPKRIHIIGIGGIGMSALAEVAQRGRGRRGVVVQGSDRSDNENVKRLRQQGIKIFMEHRAENIAGADCVVYSSAIGEDNPERAAAAAAAAVHEGITLWHRAQMLAWLMAFEGARTITISGTHGKTTTTALIGAVMTEAGLDPTIINGGMMHQYQSNVRIGNSDWLVVEGDESDGTFLKLPSDIAVVTNIDREHLSHYGSYKNLLQAFDEFIANAKQRAIEPAEINKAQARVKDITFTPQGSHFYFDGLEITLPLLGRHNIENALAAIAVARTLAIPDETTQAAFEKFQGVGRRWTLLGEKNQISFYDDYAHHPKEIAATLGAATEIKGEGRVIALLQPHRYSRLESLFDEFVACLSAADLVWLMPVFEAGEKKNNLDSRDLLRALEQNNQQVRWAENAAALPALIKNARAGDRVVALGAGSVGRWLQEAIHVG